MELNFTLWACKEVIPSAKSCLLNSLFDELLNRHKVNRCVGSFSRLGFPPSLQGLVHLSPALVGSSYPCLLHHCQRRLRQARRGKMMSLSSRSRTDNVCLGCFYYYFSFPFSFIYGLLLLLLLFCFPSQGRGRPLLGEWQVGGGGKRKGCKEVQRFCWQDFPETRLYSNFSSFNSFKSPILILGEHQCNLSNCTSCVDEEKLRLQLFVFRRGCSGHLVLFWYFPIFNLWMAQWGKLN